ncbi:SCO family protein [Novosphingobium ovatum]|nr:SCO family protein [Novosphingobium ovatum]
MTLAFKNPAVSVLRALGVALLPACLLLTACGGPGAATVDYPLAGAKIGGPFTLIDKSGKTVRWSDFDGHYRIVYFGYTFCPDACPTDVAVAMRGLDIYAKTHGAQADALRPIFISIDPARDTPQVVGQFAAAFSPRLIGLTGTPQQVDAAAKAFAAYYARGKDSADGGYLMDHSRSAFLMAPNGDPITMLPVDRGPQAVADDLAKWIK